jgi:hypothetical protein
VTLRRSAGRPRHYTFDRAKVTRELRQANAPSEQKKSREQLGGYLVRKLLLVPIADIDVPPIWKPERAARVRQAMDAGVALPPVHLGRNEPEGRGPWVIGDGIHRTNVSIERGMTHVPAIVEAWVDTPGDLVPEEPEKPILPIGTWVKLRREAARVHGHGRTQGMVEEYLGARRVGPTGRVTRHLYAIGLVKRGDDWPDTLDLSDVSFDLAPRPAWAKPTPPR